MRIARASADRAAEERHARDTDVDLDQPPAHRRWPGRIEDTEVADVERAAAKYAVQRYAADVEKIHGRAILGDDVDTPGTHRRNPEITVRINLEPVRNVVFGKGVEDLLGAIGPAPNHP